MNDSAVIAGVWKLTAYKRRFLDTGEVRSDMLPHAYILYTPGGRMMSITVEENRQPPAGTVITDEESIRLFRSIVSAYGGTYAVQGDAVAHQVELSWNEAWTGTEQVRRCVVDGDTMTLETTPRTSGTDSRQFINTLTWERVEAFPLAHRRRKPVGAIETKLKQMGLELPETHPYPSPNRTSAVRAGNVLYLSGHGTGRQKMPLGIRPFGKVGREVSEQEGYLCAKSVALCMMASIKQAIGDLDRVKRVIRLYGMVNCAPDFDRHMAVIDGASDLFYELWGPEYGRHARAAVGIAGLPRGAVLEIMGEFELQPEGFDIAAES